MGRTTKIPRRVSVDDFSRDASAKRRRTNASSDDPRSMTNPSSSLAIAARHRESGEVNETSVRELAAMMKTPRSSSSSLPQLSRNQHKTLPRDSDGSTTVQPQRLRLITPRPSAMDLPAIGSADHLDVASTTSFSSDESPCMVATHVPFELPVDCGSVAVRQGERQAAPVTEVLVQEPDSPQRKKLSLLAWFVLFVVAMMSRSESIDLRRALLAPEPNSVYVPGGGFSGFWFTLGRLRSIPEPINKTYYCYSAGCLGVVASLHNYTMPEMYRQAAGVQEQWQHGEISRYQVVPVFLDRLLKSVDETLLPRLRIITTSTKGGWGLQSVIRTPESRADLYDMLLQTTWIPVAVGGGLWYKGHMDGAFSLYQHPRCQYDVGLTPSWDLLSNVVNINLQYDKVEQFWKEGLALGL